MDVKVEFKRVIFNRLLILFAILSLIIFIQMIYAANPSGPDSITITSNTTKAPVTAKVINNSGGYIASINLSATINDVRWKGFVGYVSGSFALSDVSGSTIYDWAMSSFTGRIYATRNSSTVSWSTVNCSNFTYLNQENTIINHSNPNDNLTKTFNVTATGYNSTHDPFYVGTRFMPQNSCPSINTFVNNVTQDTTFEEIALSDGYNEIFATISEPRLVGYNGVNYDFQMIVPENGASGFASSTAYYLYVEIS